VACFAPDDLVADFSALERFARAVEMTVVTFDWDSRNTGLMGASIQARHLPMIVFSFRYTAIVPRGFKEC
jgi:peroxiredoxin